MAPLFDNSSAWFATQGDLLRGSGERGRRWGRGFLSRVPKVLVCQGQYDVRAILYGSINVSNPMVGCCPRPYSQRLVRFSIYPAINFSRNFRFDSNVWCCGLKEHAVGVSMRVCFALR